MLSYGKHTHSLCCEHTCHGNTRWGDRHRMPHKLYIHWCQPTPTDQPDQTNSASPIQSLSNLQTFITPNIHHNTDTVQKAAARRSKYGRPVFRVYYRTTKAYSQPVVFPGYKIALTYGQVGASCLPTSH